MTLLLGTVATLFCLAIMAGMAFDLAFGDEDPQAVYGHLSVGGERGQKS